MKPLPVAPVAAPIWDAPSRGHDLKHEPGVVQRPIHGDAPSRGHDLKLVYVPRSYFGKRMPPHGGMT